jgi:hypothetical protein
MIPQRGLGKLTKAMACVSAKRLPMKMLAGISVRRTFASYYFAGLGAEASPKGLRRILVVAAKYYPNTHVSRGISSMRHIHVGSLGFELYAVSVCCDVILAYPSGALS